MAREKIEHRAIKFEGFVEAYYKTIDNIKRTSEEFGDLITIDVAVKNRENKIEKWERNVDALMIDRLLNMKYNKNELIDYILGKQNDAETEF